MKKSSFWLGALGALAILLAVAQAKVLINAAGATFPYPIYGKWFEEFTKADPDAQINYQSIGSGGGIRQFTEGTVDFGASDMPMTDEPRRRNQDPQDHPPAQSRRPPALRAHFPGRPRNPRRISRTHRRLRRSRDPRDVAARCRRQPRRVLRRLLRTQRVSRGTGAH